jgi:DNA-binding NarL/FixJ family response regulator
MRLIIVEDDIDFAQILMESLQEDPEVTVEALLTNEADALQFIQSDAIHGIDCVLLDLQLPRSIEDRCISSASGLNLAFELRQRRSFWGTIMVLTNSRSLSDGERALAAGCDGYICKHSRMDSVAQMVSELRTAIKGEVLMIAREMRHVFVRGEISPKEACLMSLLNSGCSWEEIARRLGYKSPKAAANIADRIYDKLLHPGNHDGGDADGIRKRQRALDIWRKRHAPVALAP